MNLSLGTMGRSLNTGEFTNSVHDYYGLENSETWCSQKKVFSTWIPEVYDPEPQEEQINFVGDKGWEQASAGPVSGLSSLV